MHEAMVVKFWVDTSGVFPNTIRRYSSELSKFLCFPVRCNSVLDLEQAALPAPVEPHGSTLPVMEPEESSERGIGQTSCIDSAAA